MSNTHEHLHSHEDETQPVIPEFTQSDTRSKRLSFLREQTERLFPGEIFKPLREDIERSFQVPQWGPHHNEGMFMESHLDLIFQTIERVSKGEIHPSLSEGVKAMLVRAVKNHREQVGRYTLLHDISKADCLTLKFQSLEHAQSAGFVSIQPDVPITWEQWTHLLEQSDIGKRALQGDESSLADWCKQHGLKGISYFHPTAKHGETGATKLQTSGFDQDIAMLTAIEHHEDAYQFSFIDVQRYLNAYLSIDESGRDFALLGSYVDTLSSLKENGESDLTNFQAMASSREKLNASVSLLRLIGCETHEIQTALTQFIENTKKKDQAPRKPLLDLITQKINTSLDGKKFAQLFEKLFFDRTSFTQEQVQDTFAQWEKECALASYDETILRHELLSLIGGSFNAEDIEPLITQLKNDQTKVGALFGKKLGPKMKEFQLILSRAKK